MQKFLVTGGAGFIGSHLVEKLVKDGKEVVVLDDFSSGKPENLASCSEKIKLYKGDICDKELVKEAVEGVDVILHHAALGSVPKSVEDPLNTHYVNVEGTLNLLIHAKDEGVKRLIFASSSSIYGENPELPKVETMLPEPLSPYAASKIISEHYCKVFYKSYGLETVILRYFNIFGPRQEANSQYAAVIPKFVDALQSDKQPVIYGDGGQTRDFNYVDNVVSANLLASKCENVAGKAFNIAGGNSITINQLLDFITKIMKKNIEPRYETLRKGDIRHSLADIQMAKKYLNYKYNVDIYQGLETTVKYFLNQS